jgi:hypothetical protein
VSLSFILGDGGYERSLEDWPALRDQVFADLGATFTPHIIRLSDGNVVNFSDDSPTANNRRVGCHVGVPAGRLSRSACQLLFELAERARLFILFADEPTILRPPSLHGADLDLDGRDIPIVDIDSGDALFLEFKSSQGRG